MCVATAACTLLVGDDDTTTICSYNVQNLFDPAYDGSEYPEFGEGSGWDREAYHERLRRLADVLLAIRPRLDVVALVEIENERVLADLRDDYLPDLPLIHSVATDVPGSAVQVGVLSRHPILAAWSHLPLSDGDYRGRAILEVHLDVDGETLVLFVNHWKSKSGGAAATEALRREAAGIIVRRVADLALNQSGLAVILCGDFNVSPFEFDRIGGAYRTALIPEEFWESEDEIAIRRDVRDMNGETPAGVFFSPWPECFDCSRPGSYFYGGQWEPIDGFLLNRGLFDGVGLEFGKFAVVADELTLGSDGYPARWDGSRGVSDHLPVILEIKRDGGSPATTGGPPPGILSPAPPNRGWRLAMRDSGGGCVLPSVVWGSIPSRP